MDLRAELSTLLPLAISWAESQSRQVQTYGLALADRSVALARSVGVRRPDLVRVASIPALPLPDDAQLRAAAARTGLLGPNAMGLTLGYGVLVVSGHESPRLLSHELRHVHQYENAGSIAAFLSLYLRQIVEFGYHDAPLERDARAHEVGDWRASAG